MDQEIQIVGVHPVSALERVHLIEIETSSDFAQIDFGAITQATEGQPRSNWQVPYDEQRIGERAARIRVVFFFHDLDMSKPLLTAEGSKSLPAETPIPEYLSEIRYELPS